MAPVFLKKLMTLQNSRASEISRIHSHFKESAPQSPTRNIIERRLDSIENIWNESRATHTEIVVHEHAMDDPYMIN